MKKHIGFILFFTAVLAVFLWNVITLKAGFIYGDYADQFYPWSMIYSDALKNMTLPYWTRYFHSGFPLMAEGQIGGFYPLNIIFFAALPFRAAYNYIVVLHFAMAGVFTYIFTRKIGACRWGGAFAALLFCFGSAYAGCMINTPTVKTLAWMPLALWMLEMYFEKRFFGWLAAVGAVFGIQMLAGSTQVAIYSFLFYAVYFLYGAKLNGSLKYTDLVKAASGVILAAVIFLPQFMLSRTIAELSWRAGATADFALSDSFSPFNVIGMVLPSAVYWGPRFYVGVLSLLFLVMSVYCLKGFPKYRPIFAVLALSIFITLGRFNPLYVLILKLTHLYGFRGPSKAILVGLFAAAVLSGLGFTRFFSPAIESPRRKAIRFFSILLTVTVGVFFAARAALVVFSKEILGFGEWYAANHIFGKSFHRFDLSTYMGKVHSVYDGIVMSTSLTNMYMMISLGMCLAAFLLARTMMGEVKHNAIFQRTTVFALVFFDLLAFSLYGTGFRGNILDYDTLKPRAAALYETVRSDTGLFRILPYDIASAKLPNWSTPSMNAVYSIDSVALYTPLVNEYYRKALGDLEVVDNALGLKTPGADSLDNNLDLLRMLNVKYVVSPEALDKPFLEPVTEDEGVYLYKLSGYLPRAFVAKDLMPDMIDPDVQVNMLAYNSGEALLKVDMPYDGYLVFSENRYPGWEAYVDGRKAEIIDFSVIQAVRLTQGRHEVWFVFRPYGR